MADIQLNIPMPLSKRGHDTITTNIRRLIEAPIGASCFFPDIKGQTLRNAVINVGGPGWATVRAVAEGGASGYRVWKIAESTILRAKKGAR